MDDEKFMKIAIAKAQEGIAQGQAPFGAVIVLGGEVVAATHNTVWRDSDPTAHAEVNAIRQAARALKQINLQGCHLFSTCEPCPMCLGAVHWSKISRLVFGATITNALSAGFSEFLVSAVTLVEMGKSGICIETSPMACECSRLFEEWRKRDLSKAY